MLFMIVKILDLKKEIFVVFGLIILLLGIFIIFIFMLILD